ncbi:unnamed protein product [Heterobilharzia americana]|nr:unnamed protein product [Heterobilharzia americana]
MSLPVNSLGAANIALATDTPRQSSTCLESVSVNEGPEVHVGSLGLGTALAVAYDLCNDTGVINQSVSSSANLCTTNPQLSNFLSLSTMKSSSPQFSTYCRNNSTALSDHQYTIYSSAFTNGSPWITHHSDGYLTPIASVSSVFDHANSMKSHPIDNGNNHNNDDYHNHLSHSKSNSSIPNFVNNNNSEANYFPHVTFVGTTVCQPTVVCSVSDVTDFHFNNSHISNISKSSMERTNPASHIENGDRISTSNSSESKENADTTTNQVMSSADDALYELSQEEMREIDESLTANVDVMASRQWKYYTETNEWTRATCALMACLFTREQMANSTVLGRGGSRRARLPSNLVAYVVSTIRRRFNKPAAAVRARMAQKCKDERRFGRLPISSINLSIDGTLETSSQSAVAAITSSRSGSRKRSINSTKTNTKTKASSASSSSSHSINGVKQPRTPNYNTYQMNPVTDDGCSSATDSNQLPPISLSPNGDVGLCELEGLMQTSIDESSISQSEMNYANFYTINHVATISSPSSSLLVNGLNHCVLPLQSSKSSTPTYSNDSQISCGYHQ